jgi:hypothetical protein
LHFIASLAKTERQELYKNNTVENAFGKTSNTTKEILDRSLMNDIAQKANKPNK